MYTPEEGSLLSEMTDGWPATKIALDEDDEIIGYKFVTSARWIIKAGVMIQTLHSKRHRVSGRVDAAKFVDLRKE